jgi:Zn-dependent protease
LLDIMFRSFRLGSVLGFPIDVNLSFLFLLGLVALTMGGLTGVAVVLLAFASVVLHELGHALVARHLGVRVAGIELHFFGGAARIVDVPRRAGDEIAIAAAGPAVSFALAGVAHLLGGIMGGAPGAFFQLLGWINLVIGAFNLIPALPMDGGRILRALLARRMSYLRATETSVKIARVFAVGLAIYGVATLQLYLALLAVVLWFMSTAELTAAGYFGVQYRDQPDVEVLPRGAAAPDETRRHRPFWSGGFVVRRYGNRFTIEPID